jgi:hypothetical protein
MTIQDTTPIVPIPFSTEGKYVLTYVEIDVPRCALTYGSAPCTAALGVTGAIKCFNSLGTCQDRTNFDDEPVTLRFAAPNSYLPKSITAIPCLKGVQFTPGSISLGEDLGVRSSIRVDFEEFKHNDVGHDKYLSERGYDPYTRGSFWSKFRVRNPYIQGRNLRLITGLLGQTYEQMEVRHFVIESFNGPNPDSGIYSITAKDVLKQLDSDRAQSPVLSNGALLSDIASGAAALTLSPSGIGSVEYRPKGYLAIGGKEIVAYTLPHTTNFVANFNGADGATTYSDESASALPITFNGNAQIDTAQKVFGRSSLLLDGTGDYLNLNGSSDLAFSTGAFTIEGRVRRAATGVVHYLYDSRPATTNGLYPTIFINASDKLIYHTNSADRITGTTSLAADTWYHFRLIRTGNDHKLYLNGVQEGSTYTAANTYLNGASRPTIGAQGHTPATTPLNGWLDAIRVVKGEALNTTDFTVPDVPPDMGLANSDSVTITARAQLGTTAQAHSSGDRVQQVTQYVSMDPADILYDLLVHYAAIPKEYIDLDAWQLETQTYLQRVYTAYIADPVAVKTLVSELIQQAALVLWWDDVARQIRLQVLRNILTTATRFSPGNSMKSALKAADQPEKRISQVWTYYGQRNPLVPLDNVDNFRSTEATIDVTAEANYQTSAIKKIFSRWIPFGGRSIAQRLNLLQLGRYTVPPRKMTFEVLRHGTFNVSLGQGLRLEAWNIQDATGAASDAPLQVTRLNPAADRYIAESEEVLFTNFDPEDLSNRTIIIDGPVNNVNMRTLHDTIYPAPVDADVGYVTVTCRVEDNVIVGSTSTATYAFKTGNWPTGLDLVLQVRGRIQGRGGDGGPGGNAIQPNAGTPGGAGLPGGPALEATVAIDLDYQNGEIWSGGCGGSGGPGTVSQGFFTFWNGGRGGSGGAGSDPGAGGAAGVGSTISGQAGLPGTTEAGGAASGNGAAGGGPGLAGGASSASGGAAGVSIEGYTAFVTVTAAGDLRGSTSG